MTGVVAPRAHDPVVTMGEEVARFPKIGDLLEPA